MGLEKVVDYGLYKRLYRTSDQPPKFYGLPKVHKTGTPFRPIVSSVGSILYNIARYVTDTIAPSVGKNEHFVKNSNKFVDSIKGEWVEDEELRSYDVTALFTSVHIGMAPVTIRDRLEKDETLTDRTSLQPADMMRLLELCLRCTYFVF